EWLAPDMARRILVLSIGILGILALFGKVPGLSDSLVARMIIMAIGSAGLMVMFGMGGMLSLGQGAFVGLGGYSVALVVARSGLSMGFAMIVGVACALVVGAAVGAVLVRVPGIYFAVGTLGLVVAFDGLLRALPELTGGASGVRLQSIDVAIFGLGDRA